MKMLTAPTFHGPLDNHLFGLYLPKGIEPVEVHFQWRAQSRDPNDEMVLEAAVNGRVYALVYEFPLLTVRPHL